MFACDCDSRPHGGRRPQQRQGPPPGYVVEPGAQQRPQLGTVFHGESRGQGHRAGQEVHPDRFSRQHGGGHNIDDVVEQLQTHPELHPEPSYRGGRFAIEASGLGPQHAGGLDEAAGLQRDDVQQSFDADRRIESDVLLQRLSPTEAGEGLRDQHPGVRTSTGGQQTCRGDEQVTAEDRATLALRGVHRGHPPAQGGSVDQIVVHQGGAVQQLYGARTTESFGVPPGTPATQGSHSKSQCRS